MPPSDLEFLRPDWLLALYGLPLVILFYLFRRRAARFVVPHLPLWDKVFDRFRKKASWLRILVSIVVQMLLLTAAILAAAGPFRLRAVPASGPTVLIADRSLGTRALGEDGRPLAESVLEKTRELAVQAIAEGRVGIAFLGGPPRPRVVTTTRIEDVDEGLLDPGVPRGGRPYSEVAGLARDLGKAVRCALITPFAPEASAIAALREVNVALVAAGRPGSNAGIVRVERKGAGTLVARIRGNGGPRELRLLRDDEIMSRVTTTPDPGGREVEIAVPLRAGATPRLLLDPPDSFPDDDHVELVLPERERLRILVVADGRTPYLDAFLDTWRRNVEALDAEGSGRASSARFREVAADYDVIILAGVKSELPLPAGRYLLLGSSAPDLPITTKEGSAGPAEALRIRAEDPLVRALDLSEWRIDRAEPRKVGSEVDVIVDGSRGPLISRGRSGGVWFVDIAVDAVPEASTLPILNAFPLLLDAALLELLGRDAEPGLPVFAAEGLIDLLPREEPRLLLASGGFVALDSVPEGTGHLLPDLRGLFRVGSADRGRRISLAVLDHPGRPGEPLDSTDGLAPFPGTTAKEHLVLPVLAVLFALLIMEWLLFHRLLLE